MGDCGQGQTGDGRLAEIAARVSIPLVMHGGTGVPDDAVRKAISLGIAKINIDTQIRVSFCDAVIEQVHRVEREFEETDRAGEVRKYDVRKILGPTRETMKGAVVERMAVFESAGKT